MSLSDWEAEDGDLGWREYDAEGTNAYLMPDRQHIVNAIVAVEGAEKGGQINGSGLDWVIAEGLRRLGYRLVKTDV